MTTGIFAQLTYFGTNPYGCVKTQPNGLLYLIGKF